MKSEFGIIIYLTDGDTFLFISTESDCLLDHPYAANFTKLALIKNYVTFMDLLRSYFFVNYLIKKIFFYFNKIVKQTVKIRMPQQRGVYALTTVAVEEQ